MTELQWRRQWKPDLSVCPWKPLPVTKVDSNTSSSRFLVKSKFSSDVYEFLITDMVHFWYEKLGGLALKRRVTELNPSIEAPMSKVLDQISQNLESPGKETQLSVSTSEDEAELKIESLLAGMPFLYSFKADRAPETMTRDHLTVPLMAMVGELYRQRQELSKLLAAKDRQIEDYKAQGARVSRKYLETAPFDEVAFQSSMITSKGFEEEIKTFGEKAFTSSGQELYREITTKRAWLLSSPIKDEGMDGLESVNEHKGAPSIESWGNRLPPSIANKHQSSPSKSANSPVKSPQKSPGSGASSADSTPVKYGDAPALGHPKVFAINTAAQAGYGGFLIKSTA
ncbi:non-homologous end-joining factor 1 [Elysia marginata]|uniref:Non-homologous end-joining factor 1 n=1 Tax=Elysia marginata TaxID=1093978 RepID=A0AAV4ENU2_9GAST|nr:non-homologous end-joining factor 1 [Elysia marginata]